MQSQRKQFVLEVSGNAHTHTKEREYQKLFCNIVYPNRYNIGIDGAEMINEALKYNTALTDFGMSCDDIEGDKQRKIIY